MYWKEFVKVLEKSVSEQKISPNQRLLEDLDIDSFQMMVIVSELEQHGACLDFDKTDGIKSVSDLFSLIGGTTE